MNRVQKAAVIIITLLLVVLGTAYGAGYFYFGSHFLPGTELNEFDVSFKTAAEVQDLLDQKVKSYAIAVEERNGGREKIDARSIGMKYKPGGTVQKLLSGQDRLLWFIPESSFEKTDLGFVLDEKLLEEQISGLDCMQNMSAPTDARILYKEGEGFILIPEKEGSKVDLEQASELIDTAIRRGESSVDISGCYEEPKEIQATSKEEEPEHPAVSEPETHIPVSEPVMHTQEVSESVPEASRQQMPVLEGVSKQPVAAPGFHVPEPPKPSVPVDLAGQQTEEPVARPVLQTEQYPKEDQSSTEQCPGEEKTQTVLEKSHEEEKAQAAARKQEIKDMVSLYDDSNFFGENDIEDPYDGYDNADYAGYDDPEEPDYKDDVEEERSVCAPVNYHVDTTDSALTALAWFSEMVDRNGASEQEMAYVDTIVKMLAKFYFPHFVKQGYVDGKMRDTVKEIVDMMSGLV